MQIMHMVKLNLGSCSAAEQDLNLFSEIRILKPDCNIKNNFSFSYLVWYLAYLKSVYISEFILIKIQVQCKPFYLKGKKIWRQSTEHLLHKNYLYWSNIKPTNDLKQPKKKQAHDK